MDICKGILLHVIPFHMSSLKSWGEESQAKMHVGKDQDRVKIS